MQFLQLWILGFVTDSSVTFLYEQCHRIEKGSDYLTGTLHKVQCKLAGVEVRQFGAKLCYKIVTRVATTDDSYGRIVLALFNKIDDFGDILTFCLVEKCSIKSFMRNH